VHDAAAARIGTHDIVFGGGSASSSDVVQELRPGAQSVVIGHLPEVRSDANAVVIGARALIVGGYIGKAALRDVLETTDGTTFRVFARLPIGVRYAAVAVLGTTIYVFGGQTTSGADTDAVQTVDAAGNARILTHLRNTFAHAFAIANGTHVLVGGGEHGSTTRRVTFSFDTRTARATSTPDAPFAIQDTAVSSKGDAAYIAGGEARSKNLRSFERITF
jgi:N-acetylneuraminic acid mutarotase